MAERAEADTRRPVADLSLDGAGRFAATSVAALLVVAGVGLGFFLLLAFVAVGWPPLQGVDTSVVEVANEAVRGRPWAVSLLQLVTDLGDARTSWLLLSVAVMWLVIRRAGRLAAYVAVVGLGAVGLSAGIKALVARVRPMLDVPVAVAPGDASFPSGHALGVTVTFGALLLVFLPAVPPRARRTVSGAVLAVIVAVGASRVGLGVHYPSDVVAGWLLGALWLLVTAVAFRRWREEEDVLPPSTAVADRGQRPALEPAPAHDRPLPAGWQGAAELVVAGVLTWGVVLGAGLVITDALPAVQRFDLAVLRALVPYRSDPLTSVFTVLNQVGGTAGIIAAQVVAVTLVLAATRRWAPALFLLAAVVGETAIFVGVARVVSRERPPVPHPSGGVLPPTSSFPSGHVAATVATYGAVALLVFLWTRGRVRWVAVVGAGLVVVAVALARLYRGVHYPTDVLASIVFTSVWLAVCWYVIRPGRGAPGGQEG